MRKECTSAVYATVFEVEDGKARVGRESQKTCLKPDCFVFFQEDKKTFPRRKAGAFFRPGNGSEWPEMAGITGNSRMWP
jgi:hypothetical protein